MRVQVSTIEESVDADGLFKATFLQTITSPGNDVFHTPDDVLADAIKEIGQGREVYVIVVPDDALAKNRVMRDEYLYDAEFELACARAAETMRLKNELRQLDLISQMYQTIKRLEEI